MTTDKPPPLRGYREVEETRKDPLPVDPKKFQEELSKVTESDEAQKRQQRQLSKSEEEPDEEPVAQAQVAPSGDLFSLFMDGSTGSSLMSPQTPQNIKSSEAPSASSHFIIEQEAVQGPPVPGPLGQGSPVQEPSVSQPTAPMGAQGAVPSAGVPAAPAGPPSQVAPPTQNIPWPEQGPVMSWDSRLPAQGTQQASTSSQESTSSQQQASSTAPSPTRVAKKEHQDTSLLANKGRSKAQIEKEKQTKTPAPVQFTQKKETLQAPAAKGPGAQAPLPRNQPLPPTEVAKTPLTVPMLEQQGASQEATPRSKSLPSERIPLEKTPAQGHALDQERTKQAGTTHTSSFKDSSKKEEDKKESDLITTPLPMTPVEPFMPAPIGDTPAYTKLSPQVYELFEKMVGLMTIEHNQGVTTTTVTVNMKGSVFHGAEIILGHDVAAPNAFIVTIAGSTTAQELINANWANLVAAFEQSKLAFQIHLRRPILLDEYYPVKRKERDEKEKKKKK